MRDGEGLLDDQPKRQILKRDSASFEDGRGGDQSGLEGKKSKSFEEREEEYERARARIFSAKEAAAQAAQGDPGAHVVTR